MTENNRRRNAYCINTLLAALCVVACTVNSAKFTVESETVVTTKMGALSALTQQLADAMVLVREKEWPRALAALRAVIEARHFNDLPSDVKYQALSTASRVAIYHGPPKLGYGYLDRVVAMPQATYDDWLERLREADKKGNNSASVGTLTLMMQRWPDRTGQLDEEYILTVVGQASHLSADAALGLLQALYDAHWKLRWGVEASAAWRDLALLLLGKGRITEAVDVAAHVTDVYVLIAMRADRRFDALVARSPEHFDIVAATEREFQIFQSAAEKSPQALELRSWVVESLLRQQHYEAALAASDSVLSDIRSTNYPDKLYEDYDEQRSWFLDIRSTALERAGRWDEAIAQLKAASLLNQKYGGNVDQLINLGDLYCELGRPSDALAAIGSMVAATSPFGAMQLESVRLEAAAQLGDTRQVGLSLEYLRAHRADASSTYIDSLIILDQLDQGAHILVTQLLDKDQRQSALLGLQSFAPTPGTPRDKELEARRRMLITRSDVQAAIQKVGRVESYRLQAPWQ